MWQMIKVYGPSGSLPIVNIEQWNSDKDEVKNCVETSLNQTLKAVVESFMQSGWEPFWADHNSSVFYLKKFVPNVSNVSSEGELDALQEYPW